MGMLREILTIALRALRSHKMRSMLTMLGLMIGVAAVILLTSFGQGVSNSVNAAIEPVAWRRSRWPGSAVLSGW